MALQLHCCGNIPSRPFRSRNLGKGNFTDVINDQSPSLLRTSNQIVRFPTIVIDQKTIDSRSGIISALIRTKPELQFHFVKVWPHGRPADHHAPLRARLLRAPRPRVRNALDSRDADGWVRTAEQRAAGGAQARRRRSRRPWRGPLGDGRRQTPCLTRQLCSRQRGRTVLRERAREELARAP